MGKFITVIIYSVYFVFMAIYIAFPRGMGLEIANSQMMQIMLITL